MENGAALLTLAQIISELPGSIWTVVVILLLVLICQPFFLLYGLFKLREEMKRGQAVQDKRFESAVKMYEDNVLLVRNYEKLAGGFNEVLQLSIANLTKIIDKIETNQFCPLVRKETKAQ
jgi:hypothetical protein